MIEALIDYMNCGSLFCGRDLTPEVWIWAIGFMELVFVLPPAGLAHC